MKCRALVLAATMWASALVASVPAGAENLDQGKSAAQLFSANCSVCHKAARGLAQAQAGTGLRGFLRQHYTTGVDMATLLADYLNANGGGTGNKRLGGEATAAKPAATTTPRTVELPQRRPEADDDQADGEADDKQKPEQSAAKPKPDKDAKQAKDNKDTKDKDARQAAGPKEQKPTRGADKKDARTTSAKDAGKDKDAKPAPAEEKKALPLAAELAPARPAGVAAPTTNVVEAKPIEAKPIAGDKATP